MVNTDSRDPQEAIFLEKQGDSFSLGGWDFAVDEKIFYFLLSFHPQWLEAVTRAEGADGQGKIYGVGIQQRYAGRECNWASVRLATVVIRFNHRSF